MTLNDLERLFDVKTRFRPALSCSKDASFGAHCTNLNEDRPIQPATKMSPSDPSFWLCKVYEDLRGGSSWQVLDDGYIERFSWLRERSA